MLAAAAKVCFSSEQVPLEQLSCPAGRRQSAAPGSKSLSALRNDADTVHPGQPPGGSSEQQHSPGTAGWSTGARVCYR
jgi:hypothetical protein